MADGNIAELKTKNNGMLNLRQKLCAVMADMEALEMSGFNKAQNYKYLMAKDVILAARRALSKHGVAFMATEDEILGEKELTTRSGALMTSVRVRMKFSFLDSDSEERIDVVATGEGQDTGDKAVYKARTGAIKYALQNTLLIAAGDDPEDDKGEEELTQSRPAPASRPITMQTDRTCPNCGKTGSLFHKRATGLWECWRNKGGCESTFTDAQLAEAMKKTDSSKNQTDRTQAQPPAPEDESQEAPEDSFERAQAGQRLVNEKELEPLLELIALATDPEVTKNAILTRCNVRKLGELTPTQATWQIGDLKKKLAAREANKRPKK